MQSIIISINPKWCKLIEEGKKTIEIRKSIPKTPDPFKCYIYCTKANIRQQMYCDNEYSKDNFKNGKVIGEFICNERSYIRYKDCELIEKDIIFKMACVTEKEIIDYAPSKNIYGWHISKLKIYDKPKELVNFIGLRNTKFGYEQIKISRPPQSWQYAEILEDLE